jgi:hypothetical protein
MSEQENPQAAPMPEPDPALKRLDPLVGTWSMEGHLVGSDENNIKGEVTFRWLPGDFFLENRTRLDFAGMEINAPGVNWLRPRNQHLPFNRLLRLLADAPAVQVGR